MRSGGDWACDCCGEMRLRGDRTCSSRRSAGRVGLRRRLIARYFERREAVMAESGAEGTGCTVVLPPNPTWVEAVWNRMHDDGGEGDRAWINSANFAVRRDMFERIGGFNEALETDEDTEICL